MWSSVSVLWKSATVINVIKFHRLCYVKLDSNCTFHKLRPLLYLCAWRLWFGTWGVRTQRVKILGLPLAGVDLVWRRYPKALRSHWGSSLLRTRAPLAALAQISQEQRRVRRAMEQEAATALAAKQEEVAQLGEGILHHFEQILHQDSLM